ncbi:hypothetical protein MTCOM_21120 [Moorella thermoacetica]|uniref:glutamate mutase L n=1 Tax=Neomoorella thermoacetica TaxID=1525 RepID=UPI0008FB65CD|nr:glutamate mutase L [Moorella thermoacetica]OIQ59353.1 hypothetical protein MTIN_22940 [Moorella thermoacetica]
MEIKAFDVGSTFTKINAYRLEAGRLQWLARAQAPTTVQDIRVGLEKALEGLPGGPRLQDLAGQQVLASSSAAGGLRMVAIGYMPRVTAKAALEVAMNAGARVLEVLSEEDTPAYRREVLLEIKPDIVLLTGGTDGGDTEALWQNARLLADLKLPAVVIIAGNSQAQARAAEILAAAGVRHRRVANVMPTIHELRVQPAREAIHGEFIRQITRAPGLRYLEGLVPGGKVVPTPGAVLMGAELLARGYYEEKGLGSLVVIDLGGATTDVHSVIPQLEGLPLEERGLILTNEKQVAYRTVEGNLGLRVSCRGIVETVGPRQVLLRAKLPVTEEMEQELLAYCNRVEGQTETLAGNEKERCFDRGLAIAAVETALKRHAGHLSQEYNPVMGIAPGTPMGRDLRPVKYIIAVGGIFTALPEEEARAIVWEALANRGISLLPEEPEIIIDRNYLLYSLGLLASRYPYETLRFAKQYFGLHQEEY